MTADGSLERRYRRLLAWYPPGHRAAFGDEMLGVLMAASNGGSRPGLRDTLDLILGGLRTRFRAARRTLTDIDCPDSLAVCSVAAPVILLGYWLADSLYFPQVAGSVWVGRGLVVLAIAGPALLALRYRRTGALIMFALAGWLTVFLIGQLAQFWFSWILAGDILSAALTLLIAAAATAFSPGPRRGVAVLTWRSWLVLAGAGISMGVLSDYLRELPTWAAALVVAAVLVLIAVGILATIPARAARGVLMLLAVPAYPGAVWAAGISGSSAIFIGHFPNAVFLPTIALAVFVVAVALRAGRRAARGGRP